MKYEVGDIVRVRKDLRAGSDFAKDLYVTDEMAEFAGKLVTICDIDDNGYYYIIENDFLWTDDFFENEDKSGDVDKIIKEEKKSDEYEDIIDKVLSEMSEETKDTLIKQFLKGESKIAITASPIYKTISRTNGVSIQEIIGTKYGVAIVNKDGMVKL
jgi:hypothetical protein